MKNMRAAWPILLAGLLALPAAAQEMKPDELVRRMTEEVLAAVKSDRQLAAGDKQKALELAEEKVLPHVDFEAATRLAVGRAWRAASAEQKQKLTAEFRHMLVRIYSNAISAYQGQTIRVMPVHMRADDTDVTVRNQYIRPGQRPVQLDYQMHKTPQGWKIYDITIEGVSLVLTYRSEFDAVVRQRGIDGLIERIAQKNAPAN